MLKFYIYSDNEPHRTAKRINIIFYHITFLYVHGVHQQFWFINTPLFLWYIYIINKTSIDDDEDEGMKWRRRRKTDTNTQNKSRGRTHMKFVENIITHLNLIYFNIYTNVYYTYICKANFRQIPEFDSSIKILFFVHTMYTV